MPDLLLTPEHRIASTVDAMIAAGQDSELLDGVSRLQTIVEELRRDPEGRFDVPVPVANCAATAVIALRRGKRGITEAALVEMYAAYGVGDLTTEAPNDDDLRLFEAFASALWSLGAVAVQKQDWRLVRAIVDVEPVPGGYYDSWLRHAQVMGARAAEDRSDDNVLDVGLAKLASGGGFGVADATERERLICSFDFLAVLVMADSTGSVGSHYPSFAKFSEKNIEPLVVAMRDRGSLRDAVYPGPDETFRGVQSELNEMALYQAAQMRERRGGWAYRGLQTAKAWMFIREGQRWEDWQLT